MGQIDIRWGNGFATLFVISFLVLSFPLQAMGYTIGYQGIKPFAKDFSPHHEVLTTASVRLLCERMGLSGLKSSKIYRSLFKWDISSCQEIRFANDSSQWYEQVTRSPISELILGARYPDVRELTGVDAERLSYVVVGHRKDVDFDSYRIFPLWHGQLSKYHNIFGGDMALGARYWRAFLHEGIEEVRILMLEQHDQITPPNSVAAAFSMWKHDAERDASQLMHQARWFNIQLGIIAHSIQDSFSHEPLIFLDRPGNRLARASLYYGQYKNVKGEAVKVDQIYQQIGNKMPSSVAKGQSKEFLQQLELPFGTDSLDLGQIATTFTQNAQSYPSTFQAFNSEVISGFLAPYLSVYAFADLLEALAMALDQPQSKALFASKLTELFATYFSFDFTLIDGLSPLRPYDITKDQLGYEQLAGYNFYLADPLDLAALPDRSEFEASGFVPPWTIWSSLPPDTKRAQIRKRFAIRPAEQLAFNPDSRILQLPKDRFFLFKSWFRPEPSLVLAIDPQQESTPSTTGQTLLVEGRERLASSFAFLWIPPYYRVCIQRPGDGLADGYGPRLASHDPRYPLYRCQVAGENGQIMHHHFHLPAGIKFDFLKLTPP